MEEATNSLWQSIGQESDLPPSIEFNINVPVTVTFPKEFIQPEERPSQFKEGENYCIFRVMVNNEEKTISTSAFTLLRGLKEKMPLAEKTVKITKKMDGGKQFYEVEEA